MYVLLKLSGYCKSLSQIKGYLVTAADYTSVAGEIVRFGQNWNFRCRCSILKCSSDEQETLMADEKNSGNSAAGATAQPVRMVKCVKFGREMAGLGRIPREGE